MTYRRPFLFCLFSLLSMVLHGSQARYGINPSPLEDWSREQPYLNVMKTARNWISQRQGVWDSKEPLALNENGYVTSLKPGQWAATLLLTEVTEHFPGGEYIFLYDGEGEFEWKGNGRLVRSEPGRQVIQVTHKGSGFVHLILTGVNEEDYPRNMRFVHSAREELAQTEMFTPEFKARWKNVDTIRFMDWTHTNTSKQETWADRPLPGFRTYAKVGAPWEDMIRLCNDMKVHAWINIPHLADDDFIRKTAELFRDQLHPDLKVYIEYSNEVWNGMFASSRWAGTMGMERGLGPESWRAGAQFYAEQCGRMFDILDGIFTGPHAPRLKKVMATQAANIGYARITAAHGDHVRKADVWAIAPYMAFNVPVEPPQWNKTMPTADVARDWSIDQVFEYLFEHALPSAIRDMEQQKALADEYGLELAAYEGGQHLSALGNANRDTQLVDLLNNTNRDPRMEKLYLDYLDAWNRVGGGLFCHFNSAQRYTNVGAWGLFEHWGQTPDTAHKYRAVETWAKGLK